MGWGWYIKTDDLLKFVGERYHERRKEGLSKKILHPPRAFPSTYILYYYFLLFPIPQLPQFQLFSIIFILFLLPPPLASYTGKTKIWFQTAGDVRVGMEGKGVHGEDRGGGVDFLSRYSDPVILFFVRLHNSIKITQDTEINVLTIFSSIFPHL